MDTVAQTRRELAALFPPPQATEPVPVEGEGEGKAVVAPRVDGVLETVFAERGTCLDVQCAPEQIVGVVEVLDRCGWVIETVTGVDWIKEGRFAVIYDFIRFDTPDARTAVRTSIPRDNPRIATISHIFPGANWHERETHDFFGIVFDGHPNLEPLLLPEDADFHPLRKDYKP